MQGSYCNCHYCKCEKGHISCGGYGHGGGYGENEHFLGKNYSNPFNWLIFKYYSEFETCSPKNTVTLFQGKKYCYGGMEGEYCHCDYCKVFLIFDDANNHSLLSSFIGSANRTKFKISLIIHFLSARTGLGSPPRGMDTRATAAVEIVDQSKLFRGDPDTNILHFVFSVQFCCWYYPLEPDTAGLENFTKACHNLADQIHF